MISRKLFPILSAAALLAPHAIAQAGSSESSRPIAIVGARVEVGNGTVLERATVVVREGRIAVVAPNAPTDGCEVVQAEGLVVFPGFIDGYSTRHLKTPTPPTQTPRDARDNAPATMWEGNRKGIRSDLRAADLLDLDDVPRSYRQGLLAAVLAPGSGSLRGTASLVLLGEPPQVLVPDIAHEMAFRGGAGEGYPSNILGIIALMRQTLYDARRYGQMHEDVEVDPPYEGLQSVLRRSVPALFFADNEREAVRAMSLAHEFNLRLVLAGGREAFRMADTLKRMAIPVLVSLAVGSEPSVEVSGEAVSETPPLAVLEDRRLQWRERAANAARLAEAGVSFAFSSEGAGTDEFLNNVRRQIGLGLPREAALRAMALEPARIWGVADRLGTVESGKIANLVVMNADFADPKATVQMVLVAGRRIDLVKEGGK
jgi:hypothetical protein